MSEVPKGKRVQARQGLGLRCSLLLGDRTFCFPIVSRKIKKTRPADRTRFSLWWETGVARC
ncbi:MAG: hypothetical protein CAK90_05670 [Spartobacteria bacterium AMD-G4]|nr:MAG: hypothetical protein CAK90_05670 [Spartobacteria bacterium AMD-G4]